MTVMLAKKVKTSNNSKQRANTVGPSSSAEPRIPSQVSSSGTSGTRHIHYINLVLPAALQADRKWTKQILPVLVMWAGSPVDPWLIPDQDLMQLISLCPSNDADAESMDLPVIQEMYNDLLERFSFLYQDLNHQKPANAFCSQCPDIPALGMDTLKVFGIQGALSLSCAALKHAIQLLQRGDVDINNQISSQGKATMKTPPKLNRTSGKESSAALAILEKNWGINFKFPCLLVIQFQHYPKIWQLTWNGPEDSQNLPQFSLKGTRHPPYRGINYVDELGICG
ncbi:hypothetical protein F5J12DRAFT_784576 [Pisolithus orientalis]|uniref:uncharacterized protein n=1 Tax=Pisolithus orientalis TaxID=936130 RepID=UPI002224BFAE|nr:uncharacterized protein F5J12DRAFT_784576 [Pisolithus orientalis]KAI5999799.1 hypothetical protein F5J12DRAFT_784576 [Pisolithus orientalis]